MKTTQIFLLGAVVGAFTLTSFAAEPSLSPRGKDNQIKHVGSEVGATTTITYVDSGSVSLSPRAAGNQIKIVKSTNNDINPALVCLRTMSGSPKAVAECSSHTTMPGCATVAALK